MPRKAPQSDDEGVGLFFLLSMLICLLVPWTLTIIWMFVTAGRKEISEAFPATTKNGNQVTEVKHCQTMVMKERREKEMRHLRSRGRFFTRGFIFRLVVLVTLWCWLFYIMVKIHEITKTSNLYQNFDPFEILGIGRTASAAEVKKAYRKMSLKLHPDKNPSKDAEKKFIIVQKAHAALTDPIAKRNFERYGNPDGPVRMELGVAIPLIADKGSQGIVLVMFVIFFIIGVPLFLLWCMSGSGNNVGKNGVLNSTMELLSEKIVATLTAKECRELVVQSKESIYCFPNREALESSWEAQAVNDLWKEFGKTGSSSKAQSDVVANGAEIRAEMLLLAHLHRRDDLIRHEHAAILETLLPKYRLIALAMAELAKRRSVDALLASLRFHRCLVQALEVDAKASSAGSAQLLQVPHFSEERIKNWRKGPRKAMCLLSFLEMPAEERKTSLEGVGFSALELLDVDEFVISMPRIVVKHKKVYTQKRILDPDTMEFSTKCGAPCQGDTAYVEIVFVRQNLREGEAIGNAHTPLFPSAAVPEAWWIVLSKSSSSCLCQRALSREREVVIQMKIVVEKEGKNRLTLRIMSEAYEGLDLEEQISFDAKAYTEEEDCSEGGEDDKEDGSDDGSD